MLEMTSGVISTNEAERDGRIPLVVVDRDNAGLTRRNEIHPLSTTKSVFPSVYISVGMKPTSRLTYKHTDIQLGFSLSFLPSSFFTSSLSPDPLPLPL